MDRRELGLGLAGLLGLAFLTQRNKKIKRDSCCCGATKSKPCACMIEGVMECNATCPCSLEKGAESFGAEKTVCDSCETDDYTLSVCDDCGADYCRKCAGGTSWPPHPFIEDCCIEDFKDASGAESFEASERGNLYWCDDCGKYMGCESYGEWPSNMIITETEQELCGACYKKTQNAESFSAEHFDDVSPLDGPCKHCGHDMFTESHKSWFCDRKSGGCGIVAHFVNPFGAESCSAERDFACADCGEVIIDDDYEVSDEGATLCGGQFGNNCADAESFHSYKVAPDLSSYTKAELLSSIAGPQGTAAYQEVVYDPIAQSRLSAEGVSSFSPTRLMVLGASIGVALGLYKTRGD